MSEFINNKELRKETIRDILKQLHEGKSVDDVKAQFDKVFGQVSATEISEAESALIAEGMPVEEVQKLCDVHASLFKGSIVDIQPKKDPSNTAGHPVHTLKLENREIERRIEAVRAITSEIATEAGREKILEGIISLQDINIHYQKKENLFFPYMEKYGISAPPQVMWGVDDEIRAELKEVRGLLEDKSKDSKDIIAPLNEILVKIEEMIFKEEQIMVPMLIENLSLEDWKVAADESDSIGFIVDNVGKWTPTTSSPASRPGEQGIAKSDGMIKLPSGLFSLEELTAMLNTLPFDMTFVNKDDEVGFFTEGKERTFPRTRAIIGRNVSNCHPPASVHVVEDIVKDFKSGKKDQEDFWINAGSKYILIRYYAVRNEKGEYLGVLEVTQDIKPLQEITGEKRLATK